MQDILTYSAIFLAIGVIAFRVLKGMLKKQQTSPSCSGCSGCGVKDVCKK